MENKSWTLFVALFATLTAAEAVTIFCLMAGRDSVVAIGVGAGAIIPVFSALVFSFEKFTNFLN